MEKEEQIENFRALLGFKEHDIMRLEEYSINSKIKKMFPNEIIEEQYNVLGYYIALVFPFHKLGLEIDEQCHMHRPEAKEKERQKRKKLVSQLLELIQTQKILIFLLKLADYKLHC